MYLCRKDYSIIRIQFAVCLLVMLMLIVPTAAVYALESLVQQSAAPTLVNTQPITAGAILHEYDWDVTGGPAKIYVMEIDLTNPHVQVEVIPGGGKLTQRLNVSAMARNAGAVAAVNADFYNTQAEGVPIGPMVTGGRLVSSPSVLQGIYALGITADRKAHIDSFSFSGRVKAADGQEFPLSGLNKTIYWEEPEAIHSHADKLHLYNDMWGGKTRGHDLYTIPTEVLVEHGRVIDISLDKYFGFTVPDGMQILRGHGKAAAFLKSLKIGDPIDIKYTLNPAKDWSMIVGGHALLVDEGKAVPYTKDISALGGIRARTAAGVSQDGNILYLAGVEGRSFNSTGLTLTNLSRFFETLGVWKAVNLDGGGSTTMVSRPLGDFDTKRVFSPEQINERMVVNAIGIFSTAPQGALKGFVLNGKELLLIGEESEYLVKAYDQYYNPVVASELNVQWNVIGTSGAMQENRFKAQQSGVYEIKAGLNSVTATLPVEVVGKREVGALALTGTSGQVVSGSAVPLRLTLNTVSGKSRQVSADLVDWQFYGIQGSVSPQGILTIVNTGNRDYGFAVARYQGYSAPLVLQFGGEHHIDSFKTLGNISLQVYPQGVVGHLSLVADPQGINGQVTKLDYNFTNAAGTTASYVQFNGNGIILDGNAQALLVDIYGNNGGEWVRAELQDAAGTLHRVDLAQSVNWSGWRPMQINLSNTAFTKPLTLKRIYPVVTEEQRTQRLLQGTLYFKNLKLSFDSTPQQLPSSLRTLVLTVGEKGLKIDNAVKEMDVAPVIVDGRTLVPVRFISEALHAQVLWDGESRNVSVVQGRSWIDLWPNDDMMVVDGKRVDLDVAPQIISDRTMLPLRAVSQALNLSVHWNPDTRQITLQNQ